MTRLYPRRIRTVAWLVFAMVTMVARCALAKDPQPAMDPAAASALEALRAGKPQDAADQLAARVKDDPSAAPAADAAKRFAERMEALRAEHQRAYGEALDKAKALLASEPENAADVLALARRAAPDRAAPSNDATFADLATHLAAAGDELAAAGRWPQALHLYSSLAIVHPADTSLRDKVIDASRRSRMLRDYAPGTFRQLLPTTGPSGKSAAPMADSAWRDRFAGVRSEMVAEAMERCAAQYYRDVTIRTMGDSGAAALKALVQTQGIDNAFDHPIESKQSDSFIKKLDAAVAAVKDAPADAKKEAKSLLQRIESANHSTVKLPDEVVAAEFFDGACMALDPFTSMVWPGDLAEYQKATAGQFSGVGVQIQSDEQGRIRVVTPIEGGPAYKAGVKAGDVIIAIDGKSAAGITVSQATKLITGPRDSTVTLTVLHADGSQNEVAITRQAIKVASVKGWARLPGARWTYLIDPEQKVAYVRVINFTPSTLDELNEALAAASASGARSLVIDVRYNPGGSTKALIEVCDRFLSEGTILDRHVRSGGATPQPAVARSQADDVTMSLVVLINEYSANGAELLAGALQVNKRAVVVGERSFGKADEQSQFQIAGGKSALRLTTAHFVLPDGRDFQREPGAAQWGIEPDVTVRVTPAEAAKLIELRQAMEVVRDAPADAGSVPDLRDADRQLAAALLVARLQLIGQH